MKMAVRAHRRPGRRELVESPSDLAIGESSVILLTLPLSIPIETPTNYLGRGGRSRLTVSPTAGRTQPSRASGCLSRMSTDPSALKQWGNNTPPHSVHQRRHPINPRRPHAQQARAVAGATSTTAHSCELAHRCDTVSGRLEFPCT